jgi:hypothetical protein
MPNHSLPPASAPAALAAVGAGVSTNVLLLVHTRKEQNGKLPYMGQGETNGPVVAPVPLACSVAEPITRSSAQVSNHFYANGNSTVNHDVKVCCLR